MTFWGKIPAFAGMTVRGAGMTVKDAEMMNIISQG